MEVKLCKNVAQGACLTATRESWVEVDAHLHQRVGFCENICPVFSCNYQQLRSIEITVTKMPSFLLCPHKKILILMWNSPDFTGILICIICTSYLNS